MNLIERNIKTQIESALYKGKVIIIYGLRRVGKTTLANQILENQKKLGKKIKYFNCEMFSVKQSLESNNEQELKKFLGDADLVVLDEAQNVQNIGLTLKIIVDTYPEIQIIATGSSSFDLANEVGEPLVGRKRDFILYPLSIKELIDYSGYSNIVSNMEIILRYGTYPTVYLNSEEEARIELEEIASSYLYKDILIFERLKNSNIILNLLQMLAMQIGNEVSYNELSKKLGISVHTVEKYIDLLEKCFIVFTLRALTRNLRNEVSRKSKKIYFYDLGIRNALIQNFNPVNIRNDIGALWENFCIVERLKYNQAKQRFVNKYFWRMYSGQEIDYVEEHSGVFEASEFKYNKDAKFKKPTNFLNNYDNSTVQVVHSQNWYDFLI